MKKILLKLKISYSKFIEKLLVTFVKNILEKVIAEAEFNKRYKKVIKKNWLGFESIEYHERE